MTKPIRFKFLVNKYLGGISGNVPEIRTTFEHRTVPIAGGAGVTGEAFFPIFHLEDVFELPLEDEEFEPTSTSALPEVAAAIRAAEVARVVAAVEVNRERRLAVEKHLVAGNIVLVDDEPIDEPKAPRGPGRPRKTTVQS